MRRDRTWEKGIAKMVGTIVAGGLFLWFLFWWVDQ